MLRLRLLILLLAIVWLLTPAWVWHSDPSFAIAAEAQKADGQKDGSKPREQSSSLQPIRDAVKPLERAISEEPPKAIKNIKEGFRRRFNTHQESSKDK